MEPLSKVFTILIRQNRLHKLPQVAQVMDGLIEEQMQRKQRK
jgi:hypothetical protein